MTIGRRRIALVLASVVLLAVVALYVFVRGHGFDARARPGAG